MALETLNRLWLIDGFQVEHVDQSMGIPIPNYLSGETPIVIDDNLNMVAFKIQKGAVKENGINGCQVDTMIHVAKTIIEELNAKFPCRENAMTITKLDEALMWLEKRRRNREERGVEGYEKA